MRVQIVMRTMVVLVLAATVVRADAAIGRDRAAAEDRVAAAGTIAETYAEVAGRIKTATLAGNDSYLKLQELCDDIGHRIAGSKELDRAVRWAADAMRKDGQENVRLEKVMVPHWVRGRESAAMIEPRVMAMPMLGLGRSVGTPPGGITAEVISVADEAGLEALGDRAAGKIILFDNPMPPYNPDNGAGYGKTVRFRGKGARIAAKKGAVACLVRSVTAKSLRSPHTGATSYRDAKVKIPTAAITTEDAAMITRLQARGIKVVVHIEMEARSLPDVESANVIGELRGSMWPEEVVVIGGHIDSWDVGQGAHDDGAGCVMAMEAINVLRKLGLRPKRTIRVVLWTNEEYGLSGGRAYAEDHADELDRHVVAIESDSGGFRPTGYTLECTDDMRKAKAVAQLAQIMSLFSDFGGLTSGAGGSGADVSPMRGAGVILMGHHVEGARYFDYHHTAADTVDKVDPTELSRNVAVMATVAYIIADMPQRFGE